jgi:hypothetical protein
MRIYFVAPCKLHSAADDHISSYLLRKDCISWVMCWTSSIGEVYMLQKNYHWISVMMAMVCLASASQTFRAYKGRRERVREGTYLVMCLSGAASVCCPLLVLPMAVFMLCDVLKRLHPCLPTILRTARVPSTARGPLRTDPIHSLPQLCQDPCGEY